MISVGLFHHVLVYMGDLQLVHPALNLSALDAGIYGGLPHVLPLTVHLKFGWLGK